VKLGQTLEICLEALGTCGLLMPHVLLISFHIERSGMGRYHMTGIVLLQLQAGKLPSQEIKSGNI
jgi:hypothetical protein